MVCQDDEVDVDRGSWIRHGAGVDSCQDFLDPDLDIRKGVSVLFSDLAAVLGGVLQQW